MGILDALLDVTVGSARAYHAHRRMTMPRKRGKRSKEPCLPCEAQSYVDDLNTHVAQNIKATFGQGD